jgi:asparagine synthase (glutamine-hydrolysing)
VITAIAQQETRHQLRTFSLAFSDGVYDERQHQEEVAAAIGTSHHVVEIGASEIADALPDVVRHAEMPLIRTAPVPMYLLARAVRANAITVVATGEGADELFWGYDLFKEVALRELAQSDPQRAEELLDGLYGYLGPAASRRGPAWKRFLLHSENPDDPLDSHMTRAQATGAVKAFYSDEVAAATSPTASLDALRTQMPRGAAGWTRLQRACWLELNTLLEPYLLSAQGDRVAMAHGVEGRYPFLDHRVFELAARLPERQKLDGMEDKALLRHVARDVLPASIAGRAKQPYRAPGIAPFFGPGAPDWVGDCLGAQALRNSGIWNPERVAGLLRRAAQGRATGLREEMAFVAVLTTQIWHQAFIDGDRDWPADRSQPQVRIDRVSQRQPAEGAGVH